MKGYKVFNPDWTCRKMQYEVGKTYEMDESPVLCERGFHFCTRAARCFDYYDFDPKNHVAEVEAMGCVVGDETNKMCTNKIRIVRELTWEEVLRLVNTGVFNTGKENTGNRNTGNRNTGNWNTGDYNTGYYNTGSRNTGDFNTTNNATGCFCTEKQTMMFFDKPSTWTFDDWVGSDAYHAFFGHIDLTEWVTSENMTDIEKAERPESKATGGYLKKLDFKLACQEGWAKMTDDKKQAVKNLPNFDAEKFELITGIDVNE